MEDPADYLGYFEGVWEHQEERISMVSGLLVTMGILTQGQAKTASVQLQLVFMSDAPQVRVWEVLSTQMKAIIATRLISKKNWDGVSGIFESDCDVTCRVLSRDGGDTLRQFLAP